MSRVVGVGEEEVEAGLPALGVVGLQLGPELIDKGFAVGVDIVCKAGQLDLENRKKENIYHNLSLKGLDFLGFHLD